MVIINDNILFKVLFLMTQELHRYRIKNGGAVAKAAQIGHKGRRIYFLR